MNLLLIFIGKVVLFFSKTFHLGTGSTWPGHIAMETNSKFVSQILKKNPNVKVVLISGTNGKTTTSLLLAKILEQNGEKVFRNESGANLLNGIASSIIKNSSFTGNLNYNVAIFEVDENNFPLALKEFSPYAVLLLNLFRDQLDRYGEVNTVAKKWEKALLKLSKRTTIITNGDDPKLSYLALQTRHKSYFFGIGENQMESGKKPYDTDFTYCPKCQTKLKYDKISYSHLGKFKCPNCGYSNPITVSFSNLTSPLIGKYNIYNSSAAAFVTSELFDVPKDVIDKAMKFFEPAFGRQERISYKGRNILVLLSKNPAGFNQSIDAISSLNKIGSILLVLNDKIPDGRDVSWIWDVDFENLPHEAKIFISGDRAYDMGLRIKYSSLISDSELIIQNLKQAIERAVKETKPDDTLVILPTYSAMLDTRKILTGKRML